MPHGYVPFCPATGAKRIHRWEFLLPIISIGAGDIFFFSLLCWSQCIYVPKSGFYIIRYIKTKPEWSINIRGSVMPHLPLPLAHSTTLKEKYDALKYVLENIRYDQHEWDICVDLKMVNFLLGQQSGFTKYPWFLCMWDSRDWAQHYTKKDWPWREELVPCRERNIINNPLWWTETGYSSHRCTSSSAWSNRSPNLWTRMMLHLLVPHFSRINHR